MADPQDRKTAPGQLQESLKEHGQDARATWEFEGAEIVKRGGAYLPHWTSEGATYSVTFRLADSLPRAVLESYLRERHEVVKRAEAAGRAMTESEQARLRELHSEGVEKYLDAGHGDCVLRHDDAARIVRDALEHFDGQKYDIRAWCVMPNHVHVVTRPRPGHELSSVLHSWKSYTSNQINKRRGRKGTLWQPEYYDHLLRDAEDFDHAIRYVLANPGAAGLVDWPWCGTTFGDSIKRSEGPTKPW
jgi:REP element-mobilizing transposase RayT